ncbi:hypothetical protein [Dyadobacter aurulentus]|uniref:hypothetical protein n=1 Tax=Dyadobacter sp. UC 10 TaxID=2605428 RepID=UPI0011F30915|nr:hypothetical protein [Dyadobacter sp. UC 10]KAA0991919.1 hypothetical protein FXO21_17940 [Dyadobacter sp. UC 10]
MKNSILTVALFLLTASGAVFAQATTISTNPKQKTSADTGSSATATQGERKTSDGSQAQAKDSPNTATQAGRATGAGKRSEPGGKANGEATDKTRLPGNQGEATSKSGNATGSQNTTPKAKPKE